MKNSRVLLAAAFAIGMLATAAQAEIALIENGGFESALEAPEINPVGNWSAFSGGPAFPDLDTTNPLSGASHLSIIIDGQDNSFAGVQQSEENIIGGEDYTFTINAIAVGALGANTEFRLEWFNSLGEFAVDQFTTNTDITAGLTTTEYNEFSLTATAPADAVSLRAVIASQSFTAGDNFSTVFIDDASVIGPSAVPEPTSAGLVALCLTGLVARRRR